MGPARNIANKVPKLVPSNSHAFLHSRTARQATFWNSLGCSHLFSSPKSCCSDWVLHFPRNWIGKV